MAIPDLIKVSCLELSLDESPANPLTDSRPITVEAGVGDGVGVTLGVGEAVGVGVACAGPLAVGIDWLTGVLGEGAGVTGEVDVATAPSPICHHS